MCGVSTNWGVSGWCTVVRSSPCSEASRALQSRPEAWAVSFRSAVPDSRSGSRTPAAGALFADESGAEEEQGQEQHPQQGRKQQKRARGAIHGEVVNNDERIRVEQGLCKTV